jgi:diguanylate cyclase (GGDEF)-like protein
MGVRTVGVLDVGLHPVKPLSWHWVVRIVAAFAAVVVCVAAGDVLHTGIVHPWTVALGLVATALVNRVYVVMAQRGRVLEALDIAEAPLVALALLLPRGEAVLTFALASVLMELTLDRARVKKVFNVGVRVAGAGALMVPVALLGLAGRPVAAAVGGLTYSMFTAIAIALVVASVQDRTVRSVLRDGFEARVFVSAMATAIGLASAAVAVHAPAALAGIVAALVLLALSAHSAERLQHQSERVGHLLDTTTRIQRADDIEEQEAVLVEGARDTLPWKRVEVRPRPPGAAECGRELRSRDGAPRWLVITPQPGSDPWRPDDDDIVDFLAHSADATFERSTLQENLARQALVDPLTGVANRRHFDDEINNLADGSRGYGVVLCDLDHFKSVNDQLGHEVGDEILQIAAARLLASVRAGDVIARLGGDEFAVLLPGVTSREALQRIVDTIRSKFDQPVRVSRWQFESLPCSLGAASAPRDGHIPRDVMRAADASMYDVKRGRKAAHSRVVVTVPDQRTMDLDGPRRISL